MFKGLMKVQWKTVQAQKDGWGDVVGHTEKHSWIQILPHVRVR